MKNNPQSGPIRALSDEALKQILNQIMAARDAGKEYSEILPGIKSLWPEGQAPKDSNNLAKFTSMMANSPRGPAEFKKWYVNRRRRASGLDPRPDKPKAPPVKKPEPTKPQQPPATPAEPMIPKGLVKAQLRELFASSRQLVKLGAMEPDAVFDMALTYLDKL